MREAGGAAAGEHFAGVDRSGWRAHVDDERVFRGVGGRDHVLEGFFGEDLRLVEDDDVDCGEASAEALFAGAEEDAAAVGEGDLLLAVGLADGFAVS